ncbi:MAG: DNA mismatch repair endonuclease MutL, partial [Bacteroidota bacterium]|nr:DNA mismatch repair endonuclease MutL [Bacteroidota bacterium]
MSDIIRLLPDSVANQIAAGEVIQRPASVVKELMENSVDSGADKISVIIKDSGKTLVQVMDNGCGMTETDARLAFERHATSKIRDANDLFSIRTFGFRGEALPSIASVAEVDLKSRQKGNELGTELVISASKVSSQEAVSCPDGTNIAVKNLFFNIPARRKFLKSDSVELRNILNEFQRVVLAHPDVEFSLFHNNTEIYNLPKANLRQRIIRVFGKNMNQALVDLNTDTSIIKLKGYIGKLESAKKTTQMQFFFVNGRFMKHPAFHSAVMKAYEQLIPSGMMPAYFIFFEVNPDTIDVNIHPAKT